MSPTKNAPTMRNKLLSTLFLLDFALAATAQKPYYWANKQKVYPTADSSQMIAKLKDTAAIGRVSLRMRGRPDLVDVKEILVGTDKFLSFRKVKLDSFRETDFPDFEFQLPVFQLNRSTLYFNAELLLQPREGISVDSIQKVFSGRAKLVRKNPYGTFVFRATDANAIFTVANRIYESGLVDWCHPDFATETVKTLIPADPLFADQYYLNNTGQFGGAAGIDINAPEAWDITTGCPYPGPPYAPGLPDNSIRVAVLDPGGVALHEDFGYIPGGWIVNRGRVLAGYTINSATGQGAPIGTAVNDAHGTACAGVAVAGHNSLGGAGLAPKALLVPVNILFSATNDQVAAAINWTWDPAQGNADVLSNSWGRNAPADAITQAITNARTLGRLRNGVRLGCPVIFAAGNNGNAFGVAFPGNVANVIAVGAVNRNGALQAYSQTGAALDLVAPSGALEYLGDVRTTDLPGAAGVSTGDYMNVFGGTSAACPQVAGVAALMLSVNPRLTETQVRTILQQTATDMGPAGFDNDFGFGRLNAERAVLGALAVAGPDNVCTGPATYSIGAEGIGYANNCLNANVTWTTSGGLTPASGSGVTATVQAVNGYNGGSTITWSVPTSTTPFQVSRTVNVGVSATGTRRCVASASTNPCYSAFFNNQPMLLGGNNFICPGQTVVDLNGVPGVSLTSASWLPVAVPSNVSHTTSNGGRTLTLNGVQAGQTIVFTMTANAACGSRVYPGIAFFSACGSGGRLSYEAMPNPASDGLRVIQLRGENTDGILLSGESEGVAVTDELPFLARLYNLSGQMVLWSKSRGGRVDFNTGSLASGVYHLQIIGDKGIQTKTILINR